MYISKIVVNVFSKVQLKLIDIFFSSLCKDNLKLGTKLVVIN